MSDTWDPWEDVGQGRLTLDGEGSGYGTLKETRQWQVPGTWWAALTNTERASWCHWRTLNNLWKVPAIRRRVLRSGRKQMLLLPSWKLRRRRRWGTRGWLALPQSLEKWWSKQTQKPFPGIWRVRRKIGAVTINLSCLINLTASYDQMTGSVVRGVQKLLFVSTWLWLLTLLPITSS